MAKDRKKYRILVIEHNPGDFVIVENFLIGHMLDPLIVHARNFREASGILLSGDNKFDVILSDLILPDKSGQPLLREMLNIADQCPIIILTGYSNIEFSTRAISQGVFDYLLKNDLTPGSLYKSIIYAMERRKVISELTRSEKRYSDLFHLSPQPMWAYQQDTLKFVQVNQAAVRHYGYTVEEFLNMTILDIRPKNERDAIKDIVMRSGYAEGVFTGNFLHQKKTGEIIEVEIHSTPIVINNRVLRSVIAIDITERTQYEHRITKAILKTQEDERYEIGGELHDNVCQILVAGHLSLSMLKKSLPPEKMEWYEQCKGYISSALEEIRNLSHRIVPAFFDDSTLEEAFLRLFNTFNAERRFKIELRFDKSINLIPVNRDMELNLYRILQEQLNNIRKYAAATTVEVEVLIQHNKLKMKITDNGVGFDIHKSKTGIGLSNMKRRAELFSGNFSIESIPGKGSAVTVEIPLPDKNEDISNSERTQ